MLGKMTFCGSLNQHKTLVLLGLISLVSVASAGIGLKLPITIPFLSFQKTPPPQHQHHPHHRRPLQVQHRPQNLNHPRHDDHTQSSSQHFLNHAHQDQHGRIYLHDPDSTVNFFYKEHLSGPSNRVDVHHDGCREVPMDYWYNRPKSIWAKHCITLFQNGQCKGEGVQVAGMVSDLRSVGMHYGINSFKPCEKNIRIRFMPPVKHIENHLHHHQHRNVHHKRPNQIRQIQLR